MVINRIGPMSVARIAGALYAIMGLVAGIFISLASLVGAVVSEDRSAIAGMIFGVGAVVILPVVYGCLGFVISLVSTWLFNALAGALGGIELEVG